MAVQTPRKAALGRYEDRRLAALAATGDEPAFEAIFERHHRGLLSLCRHLLGSLEEAEDALQHTFAVAYRQLVEREPPEHLRAWLYATARNRCLDVLRTRRELPTELRTAATAGLAEEVERRSDLRELVDDIGRLPEDQRAALVMSEIKELGHAEVAEVLGCPRDKVRALVYQARSSLSGWREARALPCREVRQELTVARGAALRRSHLRRHLKLCRECAAFRDDMDRQRRGLAVVLPVLPSIGLTERVLEAAWGAAGASGGAAAAGGAAGGGGLAGGAAGGGLAGVLGATAVKIGVAALVLGGGAATFVGMSSREPVEPVEPAPLAAPPSERSVASEFREVAARRDRERDRASKRRRERSATASPDGTAPAQPEEEAGAAPPQTPSAPSTPTPQTPSAPSTPTPQAPTPGAPTLETPSVPLPDAEVELDLKVEPPAALP
jgi:RNA polymerase sigma factor (sigma-70 family)